MEKPLLKTNWKEFIVTKQFLRKLHNLSVTQVHSRCYYKHVAHISFEFEDAFSLGPQ